MAPQKEKLKALRENLSPDAVADCYADYSEDMRQIARIANRIKVRFAEFKKIGGDAKNIQAAYKLEGMDDPAGYLAGITKTAAILRIIPTETEGSGQVNFLPAFELPGAESDARVAMSRARSDGYNSGKNGATIDSCPFNAGTEEFVSWRDQWEDGAADRAKMVAVRKINAEPAATERRPRGRPRKTPLAQAA